MMNDRKNILIGLLCISATLLSLVLVFDRQTSQALAGSSESRTSDYVWAASRINRSSDLIYVIDVGAEKMNAYIVPQDTRSREIVLVPGSSVDLRRQFASIGGGDDTER